MICERCHAGQMVEYSHKIGGTNPTELSGAKCDRCGFIVLDNDEDVWSAVGL